MLKDELPTDRGLYCSYYIVYILTEWDEGAYRLLFLGVVTVDTCQYAHLSSSVRKS